MRTSLLTTAVLSISLALCAACFSQQKNVPANLPQPAPEMKSLAKAFEGTWSISEKFEPDEWTPNGGVGYGEEVWRPGPGGFTFMEEVHDHTPAGESFGLGLAWWDKAEGFQGIWCINTNPRGCDLNAGSNFKWDGKQQVIDNEFQRNGKTFRWHEVLTDITLNSFLQTADIGEKGAPLKRRVTIHATRVAPEPPNSPSMPTPNTRHTATPTPEMQMLGDILSGTWSGTMTTEPSPQMLGGDSGRADEVWRFSDGRLTLVEENHLKTARGESDDYAVVWWNGKAQKYQGIWCAQVNDEGCNGFEAKLEGNQVLMTGEWEKNGKRRAWREVFSPTSSTSVVQSLEVGDSVAELKRVSVIKATKVTQVPMKMDAPAAESELRAMMEECRQASLQGDTERIANCLADEYRQTDISGYVQDKTTWLNEYFKPLAELMNAGKFRWEIYERKDMQFQMYRDCAVVIGAMELKGSGARPTPQHTWVADPNASLRATLRFTHVYVKRNDKWLLAALHNQLLPPPPPANNQ